VGVGDGISEQFAGLEELEPSVLGMTVAGGQARFLARDGLEVVVHFDPAGGEVEVGDEALLFGRVLRAIEAGDRFAVWVGRAGFAEGTLASIIQEAVADAAEAAQLDFAGGEFFEAVAFERVDGFEGVEVLVAGAFEVGGRFRVVVQGSVGHVDAEFKRVSRGGLFAGVGPRARGFLGIAAVGSDLLVGCHESGFLFEMEWARSDAAREIGRGISNPI
jgi:hypothetical protein